MKADEQRGLDGRGFGGSRRLPSSWGRRVRRLTSSEATRAMGSNEAEGCGADMPFRPKADKQRGYEDRRFGRRRDCQAANTL